MLKEIVALTCIPMIIVQAPHTTESLVGEMVEEQEVQSSSSRKTRREEFLFHIEELERLEKERLERIRLEEERIERERIEKERLEAEARAKAEEEKKRQAKKITVKSNNVNRGNSIIEKSNKVKKVTCHITFYYGANNSLQGGFNDKKGKSLHSHKEPICAMPSDVPYGSYLVLDSPVRGNNTYKVVDTGGAIKWKGGNNVKVDIFVPEAKSMEWIIKNTKNCTITGTLYYK